jgi:hypothetical protein
MNRYGANVSCVVSGESQWQAAHVIPWDPNIVPDAAFPIAANLRNTPSNLLPLTATLRDSFDKHRWSLLPHPTATTNGEGNHVYTTRIYDETFKTKLFSEGQRVVCSVDPVVMEWHNAQCAKAKRDGNFRTMRAGGSDSSSDDEGSPDGGRSSGEQQNLKKSSLKRHDAIAGQMSWWEKCRLPAMGEGVHNFQTV